MIRVLIAEDMHLIRGALVALLSLEPDMDVAVLDIDLPGLDGLTAAEQLHHRLPDCRTVTSDRAQLPVECHQQDRWP